MGKIRDLNFKKRDIDMFGILLGIVLGFCLGYFIKFPTTETDINEVNTDLVGTVYVLEVTKHNIIGSANDKLISQLKSDEINYCYVEMVERDVIYNYLTTSLENAKAKKLEYEGKGYTISIVSFYLLDIESYFTTEVEKKFYLECVNNLLNSLNNKTITISTEYYQNPININIFSNLTVLQSIKNNDIKEYFELDTYKLLMQTIYKVK